MKPLSSMTTKSLQARYRRLARVLHTYDGRDELEPVINRWAMLSEIRDVLERRGATVPTVKEEA